MAVDDHEELDRPLALALIVHADHGLEFRRGAVQVDDEPPDRVGAEAMRINRAAERQLVAIDANAGASFAKALHRVAEVERVDPKRSRGKFVAREIGRNILAIQGKDKEERSKTGGS